MRLISKISGDRRGVSAVEYALLAGTIGLVLFEVLQTPAMVLADIFNRFVFGSGGATGN
jgi:Flp pilus assembly pilin Flp